MLKAYLGYWYFFHHTATFSLGLTLYFFPPLKEVVSHKKQPLTANSGEQRAGVLLQLFGTSSALITREAGGDVDQAIWNSVWKVFR